MKITKGNFKISFKDATTPKDGLIYTVSNPETVVKLKEAGYYNEDLEGIELELQYRVVESGKRSSFADVKFNFGKATARIKKPLKYTLYYATDSKELSFYNLITKEWVDNVILNSYVVNNKYYFNVYLKATKEADK